MAITWLSPHNLDFPPVTDASEDGLLAAGGDLSSQRLVSAYRQGIFPWFNDGDPILWWAPDPRMVLMTDRVNVSKSLRKVQRTTPLFITMDTAFSRVISACAQPRGKNGSTEEGTWIHPEMIDAYCQLHGQGVAHSVEVWQNDQLVGGLYGIAIGHIFFGESMFSLVSNSSKLALVALCQQLQRWQFPFIDCQLQSHHLESMGAKTMPRQTFINALDTHCVQSRLASPWQLDPDLSLKV